MTERRGPKKATPQRGPSTHDVQSAVEGVVVSPDGKVEFMGGYFGMSQSIGLMPLLQFAHAAKQGLDSGDMEGMAALYAVIRDCIDNERPQKDVDGELVDDGPSEWDRFQRHAVDHKAGGEELMAVVQKCITAISARPTTPPGDSSAGRRNTSPNSKVSSLTAGTASTAGVDRST